MNIVTQKPLPFAKSPISLYYNYDFNGEFNPPIKLPPKYTKISKKVIIFFF